MPNSNDLAAALSETVAKTVDPVTRLESRLAKDDAPKFNADAVPRHVTLKWGQAIVGFAHITGDDLFVAYTGTNDFIRRLVSTASTKTIAGDGKDGPYDDDGIISVQEDMNLSPERRMYELVLVLDDIPGVRVVIPGEENLADDVDPVAAALQAVRKSILKDWVPYEGPRGGKGWLDPQTQEVVYTDEPPGEREAGSEGQRQQPLDTGIEPEIDIHEPEWLTDEVARSSVYNAFDEDTYFEILDAISGDEDSKFPEYEMSAQQWFDGAEEWIRENGNEEHLAALQSELDQYDTNSPWGTYMEGSSAPDYLNPELADEITALNETNIPGGISAESMYIATGMTDPDDRAFVTNVNGSVGETDDDLGAKWAAESADVLTKLGYNVPEHHYEEGQFLAVAECHGTALRYVQSYSYSGPPVDDEEFFEFAAANILVGNSDGHSQNVWLDQHGDLTCIDLDLAGRDFSGTDETDLKWALGQLFSSAYDAGVVEDPHDADPPEHDSIQSWFTDNVGQHLESLANAIDTESLLSDVTDDDYRERITRNIEAAREGDLVTAESQMAYTL